MPNFLTLEGNRYPRRVVPLSAVPQFAALLGELEYDDELGRFSFKKVFRYTGAAVVSPFVKAKTAKKMFGLSAKESKQFEKGAKITRGALAVAAVAVPMFTMGPVIFGSAGAAGGAGAAGAGAAGAGAAGGISAATAATAASSTVGVVGALKKGLALFVKNAKEDGLTKFAMDSAGAVIAERFHKDQVDPTAYAQMPDQTPILHDEGGAQPMNPAPIAGSSSMAPGGIAQPPLVAGQQRGITTEPFPGDPSQDAAAMTEPLLEPVVPAEGYPPEDGVPASEQGRGGPEESEYPEIPADPAGGSNDGEDSMLGSMLRPVFGSDRPRSGVRRRRTYRRFF